VKKFGQAAFACLLAMLMLGASASAGTGVDEVRFGRIGHEMMCVCSCGQILLECNHVGCPDSARMINELNAQLSGPNSGGPDALIENWFVAKYGATVLAAPLRGGFDLVAWIVPIVLFILGTVGTALLVRMWSSRGSLVPATPGVNSSIESPDQVALRDRIRRETEY
jgi:cytochrome c-type biogenesis protein CcmH